MLIIIFDSDFVDIIFSPQDDRTLKAAYLSKALKLGYIATLRGADDTTAAV